MAIDGLKMIHIAGYDGDPEEVFEGIVGGGAFDLSALLGLGGGGSSGVPSDVTVSVTPNIAVNVPPTSLPVAPIPVPDTRDWWEKIADELVSGWPALKTWITGQTPYEPPSDDETARSFGKSRMVPAVIGAGALAVIPPAAVALAAGSAIIGFVNQITEAVADDIDPTSERWRLWGIEKKLDAIREVLSDALLITGIDEEGGIDTNISILKEALLRYGLDSQGADVYIARLQDLLDALENQQAYTPEEIDVGDLRVIGGKVIEY